VQYAIREAFGQFLGAHYRPSFFCLLDIDPANIDVNVHPTKQLVKFDDERTLFGFIFSAVKQGIGGSVVTQPDITGVHVPLMENVAVGAPDTDPTQEKLSFPATPTPPIEAPGDYHQSILAFPGTPSANVPEGPRAVVDAETSWDLISCYQIHETYILAPIKNGILLIDQHAAHERILYEQALRDIKGGRACSQQLLFPVTIELTPVEKAIVVSGRACFAAFGFETSDFSGDTLLVSSMPSFMKTIEVEETIRSMVRYLLDEKERDVVHETEIRFAAAFACGAAIKAGQKLSHEEMNALVNSLFAAQNPYTCPHGRPTLVRMSLEELSRRFLR
jgi:DNA mismatch repair protein MutL